MTRLFFGGLLVGIGTRMAAGCPSGHGICGNAMLEKTSFISTVTFLSVGIVVALLTQSNFLNLMHMNTKKHIAIILGGTLFGLVWLIQEQLYLVLSFLRLEDFGLVLVIGGALLVTLITFQLIPKLLAETFAELEHLPLRHDCQYQNGMLLVRQSLVSGGVSQVFVQDLIRSHWYG